MSAIPRTVSAVVVGLGGLVLAAWQLPPPLRASLSDLLTMKANASLGFVLAGAALWLLRPDGRGRWHRHAAQACALLTAAAGLLTLCQYLFGVDLGIDRLLASGPGKAVAGSPERMAPNTALCFALVGGAFLLLPVETQIGGRPAQLCALIVALMGFHTLLSSLYGVTALADLAPFAPMPLHTALLFLLLSVGILSLQPDQGVMAVVTSQTVGGVMARRLLLPALLLPLVIGGVRLAGERAGLYDTAAGLSLALLTNVLVLLLLIWRNAGLLYQTDIERLRVEDDLRRARHSLEGRVAQRTAALSAANAALQQEAAEREHAQQEFRATFEQAAVGIAHVAPSGRLLRVNQRLCDTLGCAEQELLRRSLQEITYPADLNAEWKEVQQLLTGEIATYAIEKRLLRENGSPVWVNLTASLVRDAAGAPEYFLSVIEDITVRKQGEEENARLLGEVRQAAVRQRAFLRDVLGSLTEGRLRLCDSPADLPKPLPPVCDPVPLSSQTLHLFRQQVRSVAEEAALPDERRYDLVLAAGEAVMNAVAHAGGGEARVHGSLARGTVQLWIRDKGRGIAEDALHRATLERGFTTAGTLGHGFFLILQMVDRVWLLTGPTGTTIVLEQERTAPEPEWLSRR